MKVTSELWRARFWSLVLNSNWKRVSSELVLTAGLPLNFI